MLTLNTRPSRLRIRARRLVKGNRERHENGVLYAHAVPAGYTVRYAEGGEGASAGVQGNVQERL